MDRKIDKMISSLRELKKLEARLMKLGGVTVSEVSLKDFQKSVADKNHISIERIKLFH